MTLLGKSHSIKVDKEKQILTGIIVSDQVIKELAPHLVAKEFDLEVSQPVVKWILDYFGKYERAPKRDIKQLFLANTPEIYRPRDEEIEAFLLKLSEECEIQSQELNEQFVIDEGLKYLKSQQLRKKTEKIQALLDAGNWEKANEELQKGKEEITTSSAERLDLNKLHICGDWKEEVKPEDEWIIQGLIARKQINVWYGPAGTGKSHFIWYMGNSVADGRQVMGVEMWKHPCIYIDLENSKATHAHLKKVFCEDAKCGMYHLTLEDNINIPNIDSEKFTNFVADLPPTVIFIDPAPLLIGQKISESKWEATLITHILRPLCGKGHTFVLVFHSLKGKVDTIKAPAEFIAQVDHFVALYPSGEVGTEKEREDKDLEEDPNAPKILYIGTRSDIKSRHEKSRFFVSFEPKAADGKRVFSTLENPAEPILDQMKEELTRHIQSCFPDSEKEEWRGMSKNEFENLIKGKIHKRVTAIRDYIDKGVGTHWQESRVKKGARMFLYYSPILDGKLQPPEGTSRHGTNLLKRRGLIV